MLGIAALAIAGIGSISAPAQAASWGTPFTTNGVVCSIRTGGTAASYPENSKLQSCLVGTPLRESVRTKVLLEPLATVRTLLNNANVKIFLWDSWAQYKQYYNVTSIPVSTPEISTLGFTNQIGIERRIHVVEFLDFGGGVRLPVTSGVPGTVMHEIGHQMDILWLPPGGTLRHSSTASGSIYHSKLLKDIAKINTYRPCVDIFKFDIPAGGPVCTGTTLNAPYANKTNWAIMQMLYPYYTTTSTNSLGTGYPEAFAETYSVLTSLGQVQTAGSQIDFYLFNDPFVCSRTYIKGWRNTGAAPANSSYLSWCQ